MISEIQNGPKTPGPDVPHRNTLKTLKFKTFETTERDKYDRIY